MNHALHADVAILGGGLAGLSLAIQLRQRDPALAVTVLERREGAAPDAAFKVGESTVEIGAHYLADVLGLPLDALVPPLDHPGREQRPRRGLAG